MRFSFACRTCLQSNEAEWAWVGKRIDCAGCGRPILVPAPMEAVDPEPGHGHDNAVANVPRSVDRLGFRCQDCGRRYSTRLELIGKKIRCSGCGAKLWVPDPGVGVSQTPGLSTIRPLGSYSASPPNPARPPRVGKEQRRQERALYREAEEVDPVPAPDAEEIGADAEGADVELDLESAFGGDGGGKRRRNRDFDDTILPSRTERMAEVEQQMQIAAEKQAARELRRKKRLAKKIGDKHLGGGMLLQDVFNILGFTAVSTVVISVICFFFPVMRFPIGGAIATIGFIVYLLGTAGFASVASDEGTQYRLMCGVVPLYKWYYLATRWEYMKGHFAFFAAGLIMLWPGLLILRLSPEWAESDAKNAEIRRKFDPVAADPSPAPAAIQQPPRPAAPPPVVEPPLQKQQPPAADVPASLPRDVDDDNDNDDMR